MQMAKVIPVESHMTEPGLGLSKRHRDELVNCANIVINIAGYSRSSQPLRYVFLKVIQFKRYLKGKN